MNQPCPDCRMEDDTPLPEARLSEGSPLSAPTRTWEDVAALPPQEQAGECTGGFAKRPDPAAHLKTCTVFIAAAPANPPYSFSTLCVDHGRKADTRAGKGDSCPFAVNSFTSPANTYLRLCQPPTPGMHTDPPLLKTDELPNKKTPGVP